MPDSLGPVEYIVIHFDSDRFGTDIVPAITALLDNRLVRLIDLAVVSKSSAGDVVILEAQELTPEIAHVFARVSGEFKPLLSEGDLMELGEGLPSGTAGAAMLFEHVWASSFGEALRAANGRLVLAERIPHEVMKEVQDSLLAVSE